MILLEIYKPKPNPDSDLVANLANSLAVSQLETKAEERKEEVIKGQTLRPKTEEEFKQEANDQAIRKVKNTDI